ncbi:uncharacterized protein [Henckelia pumila]|uniref:uncharacterized protein isoform X1 n=1 Tax=Henckelia pumila TaxID=405737 RepID=UPI003C6E3F14
MLKQKKRQTRKYDGPLYDLSAYNKCSNSTCRVAYHPLCARVAGFCVEVLNDWSFPTLEYGGIFLSSVWRSAFFLLLAYSHLLFYCHLSANNYYIHVYLSVI